MRFSVVFDEMPMYFLISLKTQHYAPVKLLPGTLTSKEPLEALAKMEPLNHPPKPAQRPVSAFLRKCTPLLHPAPYSMRSRRRIRQLLKGNKPASRPGVTRAG